ncbi:hypothetical protein HK101_002619, partial [Irineochytrium annulatum]
MSTASSAHAATPSPRAGSLRPASLAPLPPGEVRAFSSARSVRLDLPPPRHQDPAAEDGETNGETNTTTSADTADDADGATRPLPDLESGVSVDGASRLPFAGLKARRLTTVRTEASLRLTLWLVCSRLFSLLDPMWFVQPPRSVQDLFDAERVHWLFATFARKEIEQEYMLTAPELAAISIELSVGTVTGIIVVILFIAVPRDLVYRWQNLWMAVASLAVVTSFFVVGEYMDVYQNSLHFVLFSASFTLTLIQLPSYDSAVFMLKSIRTREVIRRKIFILQRALSDRWSIPLDVVQSLTPQDLLARSIDAAGGAARYGTAGISVRTLSTPDAAVVQLTTKDFEAPVGVGKWRRRVRRWLIKFESTAAEELYRRWRQVAVLANLRQDLILFALFDGVSAALDRISYCTNANVPKSTSLCGDKGNRIVYLRSAEVPLLLGLAAVSFVRRVAKSTAATQGLLALAYLVRALIIV